MKKLFACIIASIVFLGVVRCDGQRSSKDRAEYMEQNVDKIKINMTKQELINMFGKPDDYAPKIRFFYDDGGLEKASSWSYLYWDDDFSYQINFDSHTNRVIKSKKVSTGLF
jgi:hypothetical protein